MDATNWIFAGGNPLDADNAESFLTKPNRIVSDRLVEQGLIKLAPLLQQYPDRIFWGTDLGQSWHFEESVTDVVISLSREIIGKLPADIQEKNAYQNAQRVFGHFLASKP
jgi:predicted TIM-barrel fold metal-dependent hydrolase